ncbi:MAG TPA: hypothetical protein DCM14_04920 [Clostridiales bacterium UBA8153]|nr:hypothetical protein [Clostridiales bacterium UBA8153]
MDDRSTQMIFFRYNVIAPRRDPGRPRRMDPAVLRKAVARREAVPERRVRPIVELLALDPETPVQAGDLQPSPPDRHLRRLGKIRFLLPLPQQAYRRYEQDRPSKRVLRLLRAHNLRMGA